VGEVTRLIAAAAAYSGTALPIVCLSGQAGIGKTTLAIHVAHRAGGEFPDGQLYANLRGADSRGQDPADVLAGFLRELGLLPGAASRLLRRKPGANVMGGRRVEFVDMSGAWYSASTGESMSKIQREEEVGVAWLAAVGPGVAEGHSSESSTLGAC